MILSLHLTAGSRYNVYDRTLSVMILLLVFGAYGGVLQPLRVFVILLSPFLLSLPVRYEVVGKYYYELIFFAGFIAYGIISWILYSWLSPLTFLSGEGAKELGYVMLNFLGFLMITGFADRALQPGLSVLHGWVVLLVFFLPVVFAEVFLGYHLPLAAIQERALSKAGINWTVVTGTYINYNAFCVTLLYIFPFLTGFIYLKTKWFAQVSGWILLSIILLVMVINASRGAMLAVSIGLLLFLVVYFSGRVSGSAAGLMMLLLIAGVLIFADLGSISFYLSYRLASQGFEDNSRTEIFMGGLKLLEESWLLGVGPGNFEPAMLRRFGFSINVPHNFFLEILVKYGVIVLFGFSALFYRILKKCRGNTKVEKYIVYSALVTLPVTFSIDSGYLNSTAPWIYIASLYVIAGEGLTKNTDNL